MLLIDYKQRQAKVLDSREKCILGKRLLCSFRMTNTTATEIHFTTNIFRDPTMCLTLDKRPISNPKAFAGFFLCLRELSVRRKESVACTQSSDMALSIITLVSNFSARRSTEWCVLVPSQNSWVTYSILFTFLALIFSWPCMRSLESSVGWEEKNRLFLNLLPTFPLKSDWDLMCHTALEYDFFPVGGNQEMQ